jgi:hypothetical protein
MTISTRYPAELVGRGAHYHLAMFVIAEADAAAIPEPTSLLRVPHCGIDN